MVTKVNPNKAVKDHIRQIKLSAKLQKGPLTPAQEAALKRVGGAYHKHSPSDERRTKKRLEAREAKAKADMEAVVADVANPTPAEVV